MQKRRKVFFALFFIALIIGGFIGFAMAKYKADKIKVFGTLDVFELFMLVSLIMMSIGMSIDFYNTYKNKKRFGCIKFKLMSSERKRLRNGLIFLAVDTIFVFGMFLVAPDMHLLPVCFMMLILTLMYVVHYRADNGIGESGILNFGVYHGWNDVKSYKIKNETLLEMNVLAKSCGFKYDNKIKFDLDKNDKDAIEIFLSEKL